MGRVVTFAGLWAYVFGRPVLPVPEFKIDLDLDPEERFKEVLGHFAETLRDLNKTLITDEVLDLCKKIAGHRGLENPELAGEIRGISKYSKIPVEAIQTAQLLYELQTIMVPVENITWPWGQTTRHVGQQASFGCTGVVARSADDGTVTHARNLDFSFAKWLGNMTYNGVFYKQGQELFTAQMIAGYSSPLTGMRRGNNGYTIEINTRYPPKEWNVDNLMSFLFKERRTTSGWIKREVLQNIDNFEDAVHAFSTKPYASTEFDVISGKQKGVILARNLDDVYHTLTLGPNRNDYVVITNFDYWDHDFKEWLDPTSIHFGHARRIGAEKILNASTNINFEQLYKVMSDQEVMAKDTIFQAFMNVETDTYQSFLPDCEDCSGCVDNTQCLKKGEACCSERSHYTLECGSGLGGYRCGCLPDGACRAGYENTTQGDEDCCSLESHFTLACVGSTRRCGPKPSHTSEYQDMYI
eukprot:gnl/MRDRNA2_/MRDRNA2_138895_c0_seq1.p1 gnl/MRDRNA2_/MRDRNA2_138895_c0~~gnl/MRDRNA2_/MRDRNA2_138895_c0_seq1.p1  ORF type:complete len:505 (-),score=84.48 gnl/MRDRNA2_/MRDRNA2_138895_c0_seq1:38-1444(-)